MKRTTLMTIRFSEIAAFYAVSRNAVFDQLKKASEHLDNYEDKLQLLDKKQRRQTYMANYVETKGYKLD